MRKHNAQKRESKYQRIMESTHGDQRLFHSLVKEHKAKTRATDSMIIDGKLTSDPNVIREGWANYYEQLATPGSCTDWDPEVLRVHFQSSGES